MASVRYRLGIFSATTTTDRMDFSVEKTVTVVPPYGALARTEVPDSAPQILSGINNPDQMVYIKNLDTINHVDVMNAAGEIMSRVFPQMFVLLSVPAAAGIEVQADTDPVTIEYGFWSLP
jgi:hypothetical protein